MIAKISTLSLLLNLLHACNGSRAQFKSVNCEPIVGECQDQGYQYTVLSSTYDHEENYESQIVADSMIKSFDSLLPCSAYLKIFLCSVYKPACYEDALLVIGPCKSLCEHVYSTCFPLMRKFSLKWNHAFNCTHFLDDSTQRCINDLGYKQDSKLDSSRYIKQIDNLLEKINLNENNLEQNFDAYEFYATKSHINIQTSKESFYKNKYSCLKLLSEQNMTKERCILKCNAENMFTQSEKNVARLVQLVFYIFSMMCGLFTMLNILPTSQSVIDFPMCPLFSICISQVLISILNLFYYYFGHENVICKKVSSNLVQLEIPGQESSFCALSSIASYFLKWFNYSCWLFLTLFWSWPILAEIEPKTFNRYIRSYFQLLVFIFPAIKTFIILSLKNSVSSVDELSGTCSIEATNTDHLFYFTILPSSVYIIIGFGLLFLAFFKIFLVVSFQSKKANHVTENFNSKAQRSNHQSISLDDKKNTFYATTIKQEKLTQTGCLCFLSSLPILLIASCELYEYMNRDRRSKLPLTIENLHNLYDIEFYMHLNEPYLFVFLIKLSGNFFFSFLSLLFILTMRRLRLNSRNDLDSQNFVTGPNRSNLNASVQKFNADNEPCLFFNYSNHYNSNNTVETPHYCMPYMFADGAETLCACQRNNIINTR